MPAVDGLAVLLKHNLVIDRIGFVVFAGLLNLAIVSNVARGRKGLVADGPPKGRRARGRPSRIFAR